MDEPVSTSVELCTADGVTLRGDLAAPADTRAAAIICHPHPQYGGTRHDHVVGALFAALPTAGVAALRFDFRPDFDDGRGERLDAEAAATELRSRWPALPLLATGYSFGAMIALALTQPVTPGSDTRVTGCVAVAAPLAAMGARPVPGCPTLVVVPVHDQFSPPATTRPIVADWTDATLVEIEMADHFLHGRTAAVSDAVTTWVEDLLSRR
jgi:alpha/beta superfamily hydrolase